MNQVCSRRVIYIALMAVLAAVIAFGQSDLGSISGFVKDPSGSTIPNAKITVKNESGLERQATTNESGYYIVTNIPPGTYSVSVEAAGFKKFDSAGNKLNPSGTLAVDAQLTVGAATETVEVSASAQTLQTESASVQRNVTRSQIDSLELNGRNPIFMANLVPGTRGGNLSGLSFDVQPGSEQHQRRAHAGQSDHLRWRSRRSYAFQRHQPRRRRTSTPRRKSRF